jgi:hypothetical protein
MDDEQIRELWERAAGARRGPSPWAYGIPGLSWDAHDKAHVLRDPTQGWDGLFFELNAEASRRGCRISEVAAERNVSFEDFARIVRGAAYSMKVAALMVTSTERPITADDFVDAMGCPSVTAAGLLQLPELEIQLCLAFEARASPAAIADILEVSEAQVRWWIRERGASFLYPDMWTTVRESRGLPASRRGQTRSRQRSGRLVRRRSTAGSRGSPRRSSDDDVGEPAPPGGGVR